MGMSGQETPKLPRPATMVGAVDLVVDWARANSLWPLVFGTSCCAIEMMATGASHNDWARFGFEVSRASPRQADLIILAGTLVEKMVPRLLTLYAQMPAPKYVVAMGSCTISGGPFYYDSYSVVRGADRVLPVDVFIPGCPPRPETLLHGLMRLQDLIRREPAWKPRAPRPLRTGPLVDLVTRTEEEWEAGEKAKDEAQKEAREKFKAEHPDHKGYVAKRIPAPKYDEVPRRPAPKPGLGHAEMFRRVQERFPGVGPMAQGAALEDLDALGPEGALELSVPPADWLPLVLFARSDPELDLDFLIEVTAVDWKDKLEVAAHLLSVRKRHKLFLRAALPREAPAIASLVPAHPGADWHEREAYDLFGVRFEGHPDLRRIFLEDDFPGHPLRKDWADPSRTVRRPY